MIGTCKVGINSYLDTDAIIRAILQQAGFTPPAVGSATPVYYLVSLV